MIGGNVLGGLLVRVVVVGGGEGGGREHLLHTQPLPRVRDEVLVVVPWGGNNGKIATFIKHISVTCYAKNQI